MFKYDVQNLLFLTMSTTKPIFNPIHFLYRLQLHTYKEMLKEIENVCDQNKIKGDKPSVN